MGAFLMPKNAKATEIILPDIENASFEQSEPFGWAITPQDELVQNHGQTTENFYDGLNAYQLSQNQYLVESCAYISIDTDSEYVFGVKYYSLETDNALEFAIQAFDQNGEFLYESESQVNQVEKTNTWQDITVIFQSTENACKIKIKIAVNSIAGTMLIDNVYGHKNFIKMLDGASINLETTASALAEKGQIRYTGKLDKAEYENLLNTRPGASVGFILVPTVYVDSVGEFTFKGFADAGREEVLLVIEVEKWSNLYTADEDGFYNFDCAVNKIDGARLKVDISVRSFIRYYDNGQEKYLYSPYSADLNSRSIYTVALRAKADAETFKTYTKDQQEKINAYIEGREPNIAN